MVVGSITGNAQTTAEWTQQKKTQIKYLLQQIAAFQTYVGYVKKGYDIANKGLETIGNIKNGEWNLHKDFFNSLKSVNPAVEKYAKITDIVTMQVRIVKQAKLLLNRCRQSDQFTSREIEYLQTVCDNLFAECLKDIDELTMVVTSGKLEMKDDERIRRIEKIYAEMQDKQSFLLSFGNRAILLSKQRQHEQSEVFLSQKLNGIQ